MPQIFDNIEKHLRDALIEALKRAKRADFCVGYFNLRGWGQLAPFIDGWPGGEGGCCRLLIGMHQPPQEQLRRALSLHQEQQEIDQATAIALKHKLAQEFREQLMLGTPTNRDEQALHCLAAQLKERKVIVRLFLRHPLHAKLYLVYRDDPLNPKIGYLGSSNLTLAGLSKQGELNIDVLDHDACDKLARWFEDRWKDRFCLDISDELVQVIDESWARSEPIPPYYIYLKMAYHLSQEARAGLAEFRIPSDFEGKLLEFQKAAVKIAARHLNKRGGVVLGDVVGLGKTLMATALARIFEDDYGLETLIICPRNLAPMWEDYRQQYRLRARVLSITRVQQELSTLRRFRLVIIDESHNLRNREGKRYRAIADYIAKNESRVILLSATPYNKSYLDLSSQLRLFIDEKQDMGIRPERLLRELGETEFIRAHQCSPRSLAAFEKSTYADDWRELMRLYMVRRTRTFIQENYAKRDPVNGRKYLEFADRSRFYFPTRIPKTVGFKISSDDPDDQYARLFADDVVQRINDLRLPRYGLGNYVVRTPKKPPSDEEKKILDDLSRAGRRLQGFCRTNLFKRLESSGHAFLLSIARHVLRNHIFLHALENNLPIPIGTQDADILNTAMSDQDSDLWQADDDDDAREQPEALDAGPLSEQELRLRAADAYQRYRNQFARRFKWLRPDLFSPALAQDLRQDAAALMAILRLAGSWDPDRDEKLKALLKLLNKKHPKEKVLVFSQFADTIRYLEAQFKAHGMPGFATVTGNTEDPTAIVRRFSPHSNNLNGQLRPDDELRILLATDVLSEGQNLQDCAIIVNFDLPWAIIQLIQRAGRVDRIGQPAEQILCYSFLPADGVEQIIRLRARVMQRLRENAEVVGADDVFFPDQRDSQKLHELYTEKSGVLDEEEDGEVDLASYAYQIWKNATDRHPALAKEIPNLPNVTYAARPHAPEPHAPTGVLVYLRTAEGNDALAWIDEEGSSVTESQFAILKAAECGPETPALLRAEHHHDLVAAGIRLIVETEKSTGGSLGRPSSARFRTYERLKAYAESLRGTLFDSDELRRAIDDIYKYPLLQSATDALNRQLRSDISDAALAELVLTLRREGRLCHVSEDEQAGEPQLICSLGLRPLEHASQLLQNSAP